MHSPNNFRLHFTWVEHVFLTHARQIYIYMDYARITHKRCKSKVYVVKFRSLAYLVWIALRNKKFTFHIFYRVQMKFLGRKIGTTKTNFTQIKCDGSIWLSNLVICGRTSLSVRFIYSLIINQIDNWCVWENYSIEEFRVNIIDQQISINGHYSCE